MIHGRSLISLSPIKSNSIDVQKSFFKLNWFYSPKIFPFSIQNFCPLCSCLTSLSSSSGQFHQYSTGSFYANRLTLNLLAFSAEVERIFYLGVILLVNLNGVEEYLVAHLRFAPGGWWNWPIVVTEDDSQKKKFLRFKKISWSLGNVQLSPEGNPINLIKLY